MSKFLPVLLLAFGISSWTMPASAATNFWSRDGGMFPIPSCNLPGSSAVKDCFTAYIAIVGSNAYCGVTGAIEAGPVSTGPGSWWANIEVTSAGSDRPGDGVPNVRMRSGGPRQGRQGRRRSIASDEQELYDTTGRLLSIRSRAGVTQTLAYGTNSRVASVTDDFGHQLTFQWDTESPPRLSSVTAARFRSGALHVLGQQADPGYVP